MHERLKDVRRRRRRRAKGTSRIATSSSSRLDDWLRAVVATPGLTALDLDAARRVLLDDSLRAVDLVGAQRGPGRRRRLGRRRARASRSRARCPSASSSCSRPSGGSATSSSAGRRRTRASSGAAPRSRRPTGPGAALAKALAPPPVAAEWCLPLVRPGGIAILWVGETAEPDARRARRGAARGRARRGAAPGLLVLRKLGPTPPGFPRRTGRGAQAPARLTDVRASRSDVRRARLPSVRGRQRLRVREPEGRRRQDDHRRQPRRVPRRGGRARARRRPRPAGERDLRARDARERHLELRPARRRAARASSRSRRAFANLFLVPSKPELAGAAVELVAPRRRRALPRRRARRARTASTSSCSTARPRSAR